MSYLLHMLLIKKGRNYFRINKSTFHYLNELPSFFLTSPLTPPHQQGATLTVGSALRQLTSRTNIRRSFRLRSLHKWKGKWKLGVKIQKISQTSYIHQCDDVHGSIVVNVLNQNVNVL